MPNPGTSTTNVPTRWSASNSAWRTVSPDRSQVRAGPSVPPATSAPVPASRTVNGPAGAPTTTARLGALDEEADLVEPDRVRLGRRAGGHHEGQCEGEQTAGHGEGRA